MLPLRRGKTHKRVTRFTRHEEDACDTRHDAATMIFRQPLADIRQRFIMMLFIDCVMLLLCRLPACRAQERCRDMLRRLYSSAGITRQRCYASSRRRQRARAQ